MADGFGAGEGNLQKADYLADVANRTLHDLVIRSTRAEEVRNYYQVAVIGYGAAVGPAFAGALAGRELVPISEVADYPARIEPRTKKTPDGAGGIVEQQVKFPIWIDPEAGNGTPMCQALGYAKTILEKWVSEHGTGFPPTVLHISDGESTDGDPTSVAEAIKSLRTSDGEVLVYNCHLSSQRAATIQFPGSADSLPNDHARVLLGMSSILPEVFRQAASQVGIGLNEGARGFVFNADPTALVQFFDIGTRPANLR
jgi:hypothetical protein